MLTDLNFVIIYNISKDKLKIKNTSETTRSCRKRSANDRSTNRYAAIDSFDNAAPCCLTREEFDILYLNANVQLNKCYKTNADGQNFDIVNDLCPALNYEHADLRPYKKWESISHEEFMNSVNVAVQRKEVYHGIKGAFAFSALSYVKIPDVLCYDSFHTLMNVIKNFLALFKGLIYAILYYLCYIIIAVSFILISIYLTLFDVMISIGQRGNTPIIRKRAIKTDTFYPYLHSLDNKDNRFLPPWLIPKKSCYYIDAMINSILVPSGYKDSFNVKNIFQRTGNLRGTDCLNFAKCLFCYMCFHCKDNILPKEYKLFFRLFSGAVGDLLSPVFFNDTEIDELENRVIQIVCIREGLFPASEHLFCVHELIHLARYVKKWGPLRYSSTLPGEKNVSNVKSAAPPAGPASAVAMTTIARLNHSETAMSSK